MAAALAIYLLVKAGQISIGPSGVTASGGANDLNVFALGLLGVLSGLLSDSAMDRLTTAGIQLLSSNRTLSGGPVEPDKEDKKDKVSDVAAEDAASTRCETKPEDGREDRTSDPMNKASSPSGQDAPLPKGPQNSREMPGDQKADSAAAPVNGKKGFPK